MAGINAEQVMWGGLGAGCKGVVTGLAGGMMPETTIPSNVVTGGVGFAMANWGGQRVGDMGMGLLLASIGDMIEEPLKNLVGKFTGGNGNGGTKTTTVSGGTSGGSSTDSYATAKYGV